MALLQLARNLVVWARDTNSPKQLQEGERRGSAIIHFLSGVIAEREVEEILVAFGSVLMILLCSVVRGLHS